MKGGVGLRLGWRWRWGDGDGTHRGERSGRSCWIEHGAILAGAHATGRFVGSTAAHSWPWRRHRCSGSVRNATLVVVLTDAPSTSCGVRRRVRMPTTASPAPSTPSIHHEMEIVCSHVATGRTPGYVFQVGVAAADAVAASIRRAVRAAESLGGALSVSDLPVTAAAGGAAGAGGAVGCGGAGHTATSGAACGAAADCHFKRPPRTAGGLRHDRRHPVLRHHRRPAG